MTDMIALPGCDLIGCGYNVLNGFYADSRSCHSNLFDFSTDSTTVQVGGTPFLVPKDIIYHESVGTEYAVHSGHSIEEYISSTNSKTKVEGKYNFFSASVEVDIGISKAQDTENSFSKVMSKVNLFTLQLPPTNHADMLKVEAKSAIDNMEDLAKLFDTFGTHYVSELVMGGVANYSASTNKNTYNSKTDISVAAKMSYEAVVGSISSEEEAQYKEDIKSFNESSTITLLTTGGDPGLGGEDFPKHADDWASSVKDYMAMVDFLSDRSLIGIWELATTKERHDKLRGYYDTYCQDKQTEFTHTEAPLLRVKIVPLSKRQFIDEDSHAHDYLSVWGPDFGGGWYYLGQVAEPNWNTSNPYHTLLVQEVQEGSGALADIVSWEKIWNDKGSHNSNWYSFWRGVPPNPVDYVVLSDFFRGRVSSEDPPTTAETSGIKAVRRDCLVKLPNDLTFVWKDEGTHATYDASVWKLTQQSTSDTLDLGSFRPYYVATESWNKPTDREHYALKKSMVTIV